MSGSQRAESGYSFFKKYVNRKCSLMGFITRFNRALSHQRHDELVANHIDLTEQPRLMSVAMMEQQMAQIYTKAIFLRFQEEIEQSNFYICSKISSFEDSEVYSVQRYELGKTFDRERKLTYYTTPNLVSCSCRMFEFNGYPCRHMISYLKKKQILHLPEKYVIRRWTKNAKVGSIYAPITGIAVDEDTSNSLLARHGLLSHKAAILVDEGSLTDARSNFLLSEFETLQIRLKEIDNEGSIGMSKNRSTSREDTQVVCDPDAVRAKGCGKRLKSSKEKAMSKCSRQCRVCGATGHDKRTCPNLRDRPKVFYDSYHPNYEYEDTQDDGRYEATYTNIASSDFGLDSDF